MSDIDHTQHIPEPHQCGIEHLTAIINSLHFGVIAFDHNLKIICANTAAHDLIDLGDFLDTSLAAGTEENIWGNWTDMLKSIIATNKKAQFNAIKYNFKGRIRLLHLSCSPINQKDIPNPAAGTAIIEDVTDKINIEPECEIDISEDAVHGVV